MTIQEGRAQDPVLKLAVKSSQVRLEHMAALAQGVSERTRGGLACDQPAARLGYVSSEIALVQVDGRKIEEP